jgi:hypothetical protein
MRISSRSLSVVSRLLSIALRNPQDASRTLRMALRKRRTASRTLRIAVRKRRTASHTLRIAVRKRRTASHTLRIAVRKQRSALPHSTLRGSQETGRASLAIMRARAQVATWTSPRWRGGAGPAGGSEALTNTSAEKSAGRVLTERLRLVSAPRCSRARRPLRSCDAATPDTCTSGTGSERASMMLAPLVSAYATNRGSRGVGPRLVRTKGGSRETMASSFSELICLRCSESPRGTSTRPPRPCRSRRRSRRALRAWSGRAVP